MTEPGPSEIVAEAHLNSATVVAIIGILYSDCLQISVDTPMF